MFFLIFIKICYLYFIIEVTKLTKVFKLLFCKNSHLVEICSSSYITDLLGLQVTCVLPALL